MANQTIRGLNPAGSLTSNMKVPCAPTSGNDVSFSLGQLATFISADGSVPPFYYAGGPLNYGGTHQLVMSPFSCSDSTNTQSISSTAPIPFDAYVIGPNGLDVGTSGGPLDSAATYFVYGISGTAGSAMMFSENGSLPSFVSAPGYSYFRQIGSIQTDDLGNFELSTLTNSLAFLLQNNPLFTGSLFGPGFNWQTTSNNLTIGNGAQVIGGFNNIGLGNYPSSGANGQSGCFTYSDGSVFAGNKVEPTADNQYMARAIGGVGFNVDSSVSGGPGLQCGYHFGGFYGAKPGFMFYTNFVVADANMQPYDINPNVSGNVLSLKYSGSTGTKFTITFPSGSGAGFPTLDASNIFTGNNKFLSVITDTINGSTGDLKINASTTGQTIYIGHDNASSNVNIGSGVTAINFIVKNSSNTLLWVQNSGSVTTKNNTLDNGSGNALISGTLTATNTINGSINGNAATASAVAFSGITGKPTTLVGYGITDAAGLTTNNNLTGFNAVANNLVDGKLQSTGSYTGSTGTISAQDFYGGLVRVAPVAGGSVYTLPNFTAFEALGNTALGLTANHGFWTTLFNGGVGPCTFVGDTGMVLAQGSIVVLPGQSQLVYVQKVPAGTSYIVVGNNGVSQMFTRAITGATTLTASDWGSTIICQGNTPYIVTMPAASTGLNQKINFLFQQTSNAIVTVAGAAINNAIPYIANESSSFVSDGTTIFLASQSLVPLSCSYALSTTSTPTTGTRTVIFDTVQSDPRGYYNTTTGIFLPGAPGNWGVAVGVRALLSATGMATLQATVGARTLTGILSMTAGNVGTLGFTGSFIFNGSSDSTFFSFISPTNAGWGGSVANTSFTFTRNSNF